MGEYVLVANRYTRVTRNDAGRVTKREKFRKGDTLEVNDDREVERLDDAIIEKADYEVPEASSETLVAPGATSGLMTADDQALGGGVSETGTDEGQPDSGVAEEEVDGDPREPTTDDADDAANDDGLDDLDYPTLQSMAKERGIPANQSGPMLIDQIREHDANQA